jgi:UDP-N-acetylglucosamine 1-carboxyvinyltransferase
MEKMIIKGGNRLSGRVRVSGAKNAALPALSATLLTDEECIFSGFPPVADIATMGKTLRELGSEVESAGEYIRVKPGVSENFIAPYRLVKTMRASVLVLGPLLAKRGRAKVSLPGGCAIGARPIDMHLDGFQAMGAELKIRHGYVEGQARELRGTRVIFKRSTVTGTENVLMAACLARGETILENAALEPEVTDLANLLTQMGARIEGAGTDKIRITGVDKLSGARYRIIPDRIEAGTLLIAGAMCGGEVQVEGLIFDHQKTLVEKLRAAGVKVEHDYDWIRVTRAGKVKAVDFETEPFPGFPTDLQAQMMALLSTAEGTSTIMENIFENRFMHVSELDRMGADIRVEGKRAMVHGVEHLSGAPVMASDLRASASLILAGLSAEGETEVSRVYHLDRGYERLDLKLAQLGADIRRIKE